MRRMLWEERTDGVLMAPRGRAAPLQLLRTNWRRYHSKRGRGRGRHVGRHLFQEVVAGARVDRPLLN